MRVPQEGQPTASEHVTSRRLVAVRSGEMSSPRVSGQSLRVTNTPVRVLQHAYVAVLEKATDAPSVLARLRRHFRQQGQAAAQDDTPIQRIFALVRQAFQTANGEDEAGPEAVATCEIVLQAVEAAVQGYLQEQTRHDSLDDRVRDDALKLLEEERSRLARELHDETGQILTATLFKIDTCITGLPGDRAAIVSQLKDIRQTLLSATRDLHRLVYSLRPPMLSELGLVPTLHWLSRQFETQYQIPTKLQAPDVCRLPEAVEMAIFRIVQEALTNVARHARARSVHVELKVEPRRVICTVQDDGRGFDPDRAINAEAPRLGLLGMRERARQLGGSLVITSAPDRGATVRATFPYAGGRSG
jgi:signal transduction histidine kinase